MTAFHVYLSSPKVKKVLSTKPGEEGFSLIELVVVVAVLAILAAIAIPSFTAIQDNAAQAGAKSTIANFAKECAVLQANMQGGTNAFVFGASNLSGYDILPTNPNSCNGVGGTNANPTYIIRATVAAGAPLSVPRTIQINWATGAKTCTTDNNTTAAFCTNNAW